MFYNKLIIISLLFSLLLFSCKTTPIVSSPKEEELEEEVKTENTSKIGDLWLDDNTYMVSATGYPRADAKENLRESALKAAYELAYIKIEYAFMKEMRVKDNSTSETIKRIIDKYIVETKVEYINERYINLTVIVKASFLRQHLKNNTLDRLL